MTFKQQNVAIEDQKADQCRFIQDAIVRFILIPEFGGRVLNQLEATSDTMLWHNESTTKPKMDATFYYPTPRHAGASYNNA